MINVKSSAYGACGDSKTNNLAAFAAAVAALPASGGAIYIPPGEYFLDFKGAGTGAQSIVAMNITKNNVAIIGDGDASHIILGGITATDLNACSEDVSGANIATVFAFTGVDGGSVSSLRITGTGGATPLNPGKARAQGVGVLNSRNIQILRVTGSDIPGNLINFRGSTGSEATSTARSSAVQCVAENCSENGINYMGGTYKCQLIGCTSCGNQYHGFESGTEGLICIGNVLCDNARYGIVHVANNGIITGNKTSRNFKGGTAGGGIALTWANTVGGGYEASHNHVSNNEINETRAGAHGVVVTGRSDGNHVTSNRIIATRHSVVVNSNGQSDGCTETVVQHNKCKCTGRADPCIKFKAPVTNGVFWPNYVEGGTDTQPSVGLFVSNSVPVATATLGSLTRRIEVFDELGSSLGFVPVYEPNSP